MRSGFALLLSVAIWSLLLSAPSRAQAPAPTAELYRIRVVNAVDGVVDVSMDGGASYFMVGKVTQPATALTPGYAASRWAEPSSVTATAVHSIHIKARTTGPRDPQCASGSMLLSLVPKDFRTPPKGYGSYLPGKSGIYTDIPAGEAIFRNLAPFVGSAVRLEREGGLAPFPDDYTPAIGDRIVILVAPRELPQQIVFENWKSGLVTLIRAGRDPEPIARVERPVLGVGRYDGTTYTGVGRINTNHCGVITVSTATTTGVLLPEGEGSERRGGFQIEPSNHAEVVSHQAPQVMVVAPLDQKESLEGEPPLFSGNIGLYWDPRSPERSLTVEVKIDNGPWEAMPEGMGRQDDFFTAAALNKYFAERGMERKITSGVTHLRFVFPHLNAETVAQYIAPYAPGGKPPITTASSAGTRPPVSITPIPDNPPGALVSGAAPPPGGAAPKPAETHVSGVVTLNVALKNVPDAQVSLMAVYVDGRVLAIMNTPPFRHNLDTRRLKDGSHEVELRAMDSQGNIIAAKKTTILVQNTPETPGEPG